MIFSNEYQKNVTLKLITWITFNKNSKGLWIIVASIWNMIPNKELYDLDLIGFG